MGIIKLLHCRDIDDNGQRPAQGAAGGQPIQSVPVLMPQVSPATAQASVVQAAMQPQHPQPQSSVNQSRQQPVYGPSNPLVQPAVIPPFPPFAGQQGMQPAQPAAAGVAPTQGAMAMQASSGFISSQGMPIPQAPAPTRFISYSEGYLCNTVEIHASISYEHHENCTIFIHLCRN